MIPICPRCDQRLIILEFNNVEVDYCHDCKGLWLDAGELELLLERTGATEIPALRFEVEPPDKKGHRILCPRCDRQLERVSAENFEGTPQLDRCPVGHGLWFDKGELQQLIACFDPAAGASKTVEYLNQALGAPEKT